MRLHFGHHHHDHHRHGGPREGSFRKGPFEMRWSVGRGDEERGPRGRGRRMFDAGALRLILLKLLADAPRHGYDLIRAIDERTGGAYAPSPGVVYPTLTMLDDMGFIDEQRSDGARRLFAVNAAGEAHLAEKAEEVAALFARLDAMAESARPREEAPVRRAMMNLRAVLQHRLSREDVTAEVAHDVAALIDEVAQKIERL